MRLRLHHWLTVLGLAASLHLGLMLLLDPPRPGARGPGQGGIEIALGPTGGAARAVAETREQESPEDSLAQSPSGRAEAPAPSAAVERRPEPETVVSKPKEPKPEPEPKPKPEPKPEPEPKPAPTRTAKPLAERPAPAPSSSPAARRSEPQPPAPQSGPAGAGDAGAGQTGPDPVGAGDATPGGGDPGAAADYLARLRAWLERHQRYPLKARLRRQQGRVRLGFVVDSQGRVLSRRIEAGSGHALLDREALELLRRAEPLPAPPPGLGRPELIVPVVFSLR